MGLFDLFKSKSKPPSPAAPAGDKNLARLGRVAGDKHAQNYDRIEAIEALARAPSADSAAALLRRFTFHIDPSITDQEEKEIAHRGILAAGEAAIEPIRNFCVKAESLSWPLKILKELVPPEGYSAELVSLLDRFDTEYARNTEPKQQLLAELEQKPMPEARAAAERFLDDVSEPVRFVAAAAVLAHNDQASVAPLVNTLVGEESVRVKNRIADGLAFRSWVIPDELRGKLKPTLPPAYALDGGGTIRKR
jgi:hypothetical protein